MRITSQVTDESVKRRRNLRDSRKSHHVTGTVRFAAIDGEGVKGYDSPNEVAITFCIDCNSDITHANRYWISECGPYCHDCYFDRKRTNLQSMLRMR